MSRVIILIGNVGSGKSLVASKLAKKGAVVVNMDSIQEMIGGGEYGAYDYDKKEIYLSVENTIIATALGQGFDVVVDRTNMDKKRRKRFIDLAHDHGSEAVCFKAPVGNSTKQLINRMKDQRGISRETWFKVSASMISAYEEPSKDEGFSEILEIPSKYTSYAFDFDGTIVENKFPEIGDVFPETVAKMKKLWMRLSNLIIIWTARSGNY